MKFAEVYDKMNADLHSAKMTQVTFEILNHFGKEVSDCLDLCCGTGTAVKIFTEAGLNASGLDGSRKMLSAARKKLKGSSVKFYHQQLPRFDIKEKAGSNKLRRFDLVTSFYDSLNYLLKASDLKRCFQSTYRHLRPGGLFVFDMNSAYFIRNLLAEMPHADSRDDLAWVWKCSYDKKTDLGSIQTTFFVKDGRQWRRFDELHYERGYTNTEIKRMLREAGFRVRGFHKCYTFDPPTPRTQRICVVAQRPEAKMA